MRSCGKKVETGLAVSFFLGDERILRLILTFSNAPHNRAGGEKRRKFLVEGKENYKTSSPCLRCILGNKLTWVRETMQSLHGSPWRKITQKNHHKNQPKGKLSRFTRDTAQLRGCFADDGALTGTACLGRRVGPRAATMCARCSTKLRRGSESFTGWWTGTTRPPALRTRWLHQHRP